MCITTAQTVVVAAPLDVDADSPDSDFEAPTPHGSLPAASPTCTRTRSTATGGTESRRVPSQEAKEEERKRTGESLGCRLGAYNVF